MDYKEVYTQIIVEQLKMKEDILSKLAWEGSTVELSNSTINQHPLMPLLYKCTDTILRTCEILRDLEAPKKQPIEKAFDVL